MDDADDLRQWRKAQRAELLARRLAALGELRHRWSTAITRWLLDGFPLLQTMVVGLYWPFQGEFDPRFAIRRLRERGATAALPVVLQKGMPLEFRAWWPGVPTAPGVFDLPVPQGTRVLQPQALLIPPVGFDTQGYRLGYGGGYFDRTLAALAPHPLKIGVAFELSRIATIRPQAYDIPMDFIVTEAGIHHASDRGLTRIDDPVAASERAQRIVDQRARHHQPSSSSGVGSTACQVPREYASPPCYAHELDPWYRDQ